MHGVLGEHAGFRFGSCDSASNVRQGITDSFWKESRLRVACACGAVGPKVTFLVLARERKEQR